MITPVEGEACRRVPDGVDLDAGLRADHHGGIRPPAIEGGMSDRTPSPLIAKNDGRGLIHTRGSGIRTGRDARGFAEQVPCEGNRIDAEIQQRSPAEFRCVDPVGRIHGKFLGVVGDQRADFPQPPRGDDFPEANHVGQPPCPHGLQGNQPLALSQRDHLAGLAGIHGERLLHQHMLPCLQGHPCIRGMKRMGCGHIHRIHLRVGAERFIGGMS